MKAKEVAVLVQALRGSEVLEALYLWGTWLAGHMGHVVGACVWSR